MKTIYIFGYGSLISAQSRARSGSSGPGIPVLVKGIKRGWILRIESDKVTSLGAELQPNSITNGVLFQVPESELPNFDKRELVHDYHRVKIDTANIILLSQNVSLHNSEVWVYVSKSFISPTDDYPIAQSYVDVVLTGCLDISELFANQFVDTTSGWVNPWLNDRPRYIRYPGRSLEIEHKIDAILAKCVPLELQQRRLAT